MDSMSDMIPAPAVDAAYDAFRHLDITSSDIEGILEAAAPHMLNLAKREAWDANLEIQRLRSALAKAAK